MADGSILTEVFQTVAKGHNGLLDPMLLQNGQASRLHNVVVRNGLAESRPALFGAETPCQGRFQGAFAYELENDLRWVVVVSGHIWVYSSSNRTWMDVFTFPTVDFPSAYFCQAGKYCIVQNGVYAPVENWPAILHGDELVDNLEVEYISGNEIVKVKDYRELDADGSHIIRVPIGKAMAFGQGRLFVAVERYWDHGLAGGTRGWHSGEGLRHVVASDDERADDPARMLVFTQNDVLAGGGALSLPVESGFITSMTFFRNASTGTGLGELFVLCRRGSAAFAVSTDRATEWGAAGFGQQLFQSSGSSCPWALAAVNSDLVYCGDDGLRTIKFSASNETASGGLASVPLSPEVDNYWSKTLAAHQPFVTLASAGNYVFFTAGGRELPDGSVAFTDVLPWDLANFQVSGETPSRTFAGAWRGPLFHAVLRLSPTSSGAIYRDSVSGNLKFGEFSGNDADMVSAVRTPAYPFKAALAVKRPKYADLMFDRVNTDLAVKIRWRADSGPWFASDVRRFQPSAAGASTGMFRVPIEVDSDGVGHLVEFAIEWTGHARLRLCAFAAVSVATFSGDEVPMCSALSLDPPAETMDIPEE